MQQERALTRWADAGHLIERTGGNRAAALGAVRADGEPVDLVAQALEVEQHGRGFGSILSRPSMKWNTSRPSRPWCGPSAMPIRLTSSMPMASSVSRASGHLALAAVDQHEIRAICPDSRSGSFSCACAEAPLEHFAHHSRNRHWSAAVLMFHLRYWPVMKPSGPATIIAPTACAPCTWLLSVDLNALRRFAQFEEFGHLAPACRALVPLPPAAGRAPRPRCAAPAPSARRPVTAPGTDILDLAARRAGSASASRSRLGQFAVEQDQARRGGLPHRTARGS